MPARDPWQTRPKYASFLRPPRVRLCVFVRCVRSHAAGAHEEDGVTAFAPVSRASGSGIPLALPMAVAKRHQRHHSHRSVPSLGHNEAVMLKRLFLMLAVMLIFIAALGFFKFQQIQTAIAKGAAFQPPPAAVTTIVAAQEEWPATLSAIGTMAAVQGVTVSADLPGTVDRITFESGRAVREGEVLAELDTRQERAQLAAIEAQRELARLNYERMKGLLSDRVVSQAEFDRAMAEEKQTTAQVGEIQATIDRKTIRAPFSGVLGIRQVNLGQYLAPGDPLVPLQSLDPIYVNFGVPQQDIPRIRVGHRVTVRADDLAGAVQRACDGIRLDR